MSDDAVVFLDGGYLDRILEGFGFLGIDYRAFSDRRCELSGGLVRFLRLALGGPPGVQSGGLGIRAGTLQCSRQH
jgi:hypothetical protein